MEILKGRILKIAIKREREVHNTEEYIPIEIKEIKFNANTKARLK